MNDSTIVHRSSSPLFMIIMEIVGLDKQYLEIMKLEVLFLECRSSVYQMNTPQITVVNFGEMFLLKTI